ncbi:zf-DHHC-domain-containing protein [Basidiobolus meristosporus CBS 931.73]|uniref:Palmitoyltransferase n=1 Tax=Basidiobolus meristosporus CBS 931.73 TaxID=1314790 RepID=A0A1Y1YWA2_9FUNG|nr:zf-DHHC-domain-containing protein [Basidiobolus meristosporus CBS 931.73]|eukprot:ORY02239.1 zf-DHHC-domain-containing protein [Basidiobolus meristosporus CBS 931.73]
MKPSSSPRHIDESFAGKNKILLRGTIVTGRDFWALGVTLLLIHTPVILFSVFVCPFVYINISPAVVFVFVYLYLLCVFSLFKTSWTDPGIIPRNLDPIQPMATLGEPSSSSDLVDPSYYPVSTYPGMKDVLINGVSLKLKYCDTCQLYRPPRCSHCRQCDNCVENEDHHCIWVNNCVGRRNYPLTVYHLYLISKNMTTHEQIRSSVNIRRAPHPFNLGNFAKNLMQFIARPKPPSYIEWRKIHEHSSRMTSLPRFKPAFHQEQEPTNL